MASPFTLPRWLQRHMEGRWKHFQTRGESIVGVSGGRTSALMAVLLEVANPGVDDLLFTFQNTGYEHEKTYEFLRNLKDAFVTPFKWLEFRPPKNVGDQPALGRIREVRFETANRTGKPFRDMLQCLADYRRVQKGLGPVAPFGNMRLCTSYLKIKLQQKYAREVLRWDEWDQYIGIRYDEIQRFHKARTRDTSYLTTHAPLGDAKITKEMVNDFWSAQPFDLALPENLGNCTLCFLKDEADLAWNMTYELPREHSDAWIKLQKDFGSFKIGANYEQIRREAGVRFRIREQLNQDAVPTYDRKDAQYNVDQHRFTLLVRQERRVKKHGLQRIACNCEGAEKIEDEGLLDV